MHQEKALESNVQIKYAINPSKIGTVLGIVSIYLAAQSLFNEYLIENVLSRDTNITTLLLLDLFSVNVESSIPTWYSTLLLFAAALLLATITKAKWKLRDRFRYYWAGLAVLFIYLSMDEGAAIHEIIVDPLQTLFNPTGYLAFAWQLVAVPLVIGFVLLYIRFILHLPLRWRYLFVLSGVVYVGGALIVEAISANRWYIDGGVTFPYLAIATIEELFEMLGAVLFIYTLLSYMTENQYTLSVAAAPLINTEYAPTDSLSNISNRKPNSINWKRLILPLLGFLLLVNGAIYFWAISLQTATTSSAADAVPFYQDVIEQYSGQGVVVLRFNGTFTPSNPATAQLAKSLLVLFDDVMVVSLPQDNYSVAFAGSALPFNKDDLDTILNTNGNEDFSILGTQEIKVLAQADN